MKGIKKRWVKNYILVVVSVMFIIETIFIVSISNYYYRSVEENLKNRASVNAGFYNKYLGADTFNLQDNVNILIQDFSYKDYAELQILDLRGNVLGTSTGFIPEEKIQSDDYIKALRGDTSTWQGRTADGERIMAVSSPLKYDEETVIGVLRYITSLENIDIILQRWILLSLLVIMGIIVFMFISSIVFNQSIIIPINEITAIANRMARGEFSERITKHYNDEIGELADTLNYMASEILKVQELKNDFISSISHELRTPLTAIKGWSETILTGDLDDKEETTLGLKIIIKETARLTDMVEDLLDFSKLEAGRIRLHLEQVDMERELFEIIQIYEGRSKKEHITINYHVVNQIPIILGDRNRLKQVLINIIDNAIKFSDVGKEVYITIKESNGQIFITVKDQGIGITEDELNRVRQKFYKGKGSKAGSGLGLAISDEIIKLHKGKMIIESQVYKGTQVTIILPTNL